MPEIFNKYKNSKDVSYRSGLDPLPIFVEDGSSNDKMEFYCFRVKLFVSWFFELLKLNDFLLSIQKRVVSGGKFIRVINYHCIPQTYEIQFEKQLQYYKMHFSDVTENDLSDFLFQKTWNKKKPGLIISFDDGDLSNYSIAAPLLEKYGFTGWFFIPTCFSCCDPVLQRDFASEHFITFSETGHPRIAMSLDELSDLVKRGHVIGSHTQHHYRLRSNLDSAIIKDEIIGSKEFLEHHIGKNINTFSWVGGETVSYSPEAAQLISDAGYQFSFMTNSSPLLFSTNRLQLQRTNIEASWPEDLIKFQLSGILDLVYFYKRRKINRITSVKSGSKFFNTDEENFSK